MWPIGHAAIAYLFYTASTRSRFDTSPTHGPALVVVFGGLFPDLIDKPLAWKLGVLPTGRSLAHSLLVLLPLVAVVFILARQYNRSEYGIAFAIGALSHLLVDALPALWTGETPNFLLWPVLSVSTPESGAPTVLELFRSSLSDPYFLTEFVALAIAIALWRADGYPGAKGVLAPLRAVRG